MRIGCFLKSDCSGKFRRLFLSGGAALVLVLASACAQLASAPTVDPASHLTEIAERVAATLTAAAPLPSFLPTAAPTKLAPTVVNAAPTGTAGAVPTPAVPASRFFTDARYALAD